MNEQLELALITSEETNIPEDENKHGDLNASDLSEKLKLQIEKGNQVQNEEEEEIQQQNKDRKADDEDNGENNGEENNDDEDNINADDGNGYGKGNNMDNPAMAGQLKAMKEFVPFVGILGWTTFVNALGTQFHRDSGICVSFRMALQWIYFLFCIVITFIFYMRQQRLINDDFAYINGANKKLKVYKWRYVISHLIVTILYLLTINEQPIACHLKKEEHIAYLNYAQVAIVSLTTATLKGFQEFASNNGDDPLADYTFDYLNHCKCKSECIQKVCKCLCNGACICCLVCIVIVLIIIIIVIAVISAES